MIILDELKAEMTGYRKEIEELADVLIYSILMADACGLDLDQIVREKIKRNNEKYPVEKAYGNKEKYTELGMELNSRENSLSGK